MESYRRDTGDEQVRDPETGELREPGHVEATSEGFGHDDASTNDVRPGETTSDHNDFGAPRDPAFSAAERDDLDGGDDLHGRNDVTGTSAFDDENDLDKNDVGKNDVDKRDVTENDLDEDDVLARRSDLDEPVTTPGAGTFGRDASADGDVVVAGQPDSLSYPDEADLPTREESGLRTDTADTSDTSDTATVAGVTDVPDLEPEPVLAAGAADEGRDVTGDTVTTGTSAPSIDFAQRWHEVQTSFVDDPRDAVEQADGLVDEAVSALASRRQELVDRWKNSDHNDTEQLRLALREYRSLLGELVGLSPSPAGGSATSGSFPARNEVR